MRFTTLKNEPLMGKVWNDDKTVCYGSYGQVGTLLQRGVLYDIDAGREMWIFLPKGTAESGQCVPQPSKESLKAFLQLRLVEDARPCQCCKEMFARNEMMYTKDCRGINYRLVCHDCYDELMQEGYDGQYYDVRDENIVDYW